MKKPSVESREEDWKSTIMMTWAVASYQLGGIQLTDDDNLSSIDNAVRCF
jgi:high-affinity nickel permease